jgi:hypothetical protein
MKSLLSGLKANDNEAYNKMLGHTAKDGESSEDEDASEFVRKRTSSNQFNAMGMNLNKY